MNNAPTPPGSYLWEPERGYYARVNKDGTEDRRFTADGSCSFLNGFTRGVTLSDPQTTARSLMGPRGNDYVVKGYTLLIDEDVNLHSAHWLALAAKQLDGLYGIHKILKTISQDKKVEHNAKLEALRLLFDKEIKRRKLGDDPRVVAAREAFEARRAEEQRRLEEEEALHREIESLKRAYKDQLLEALEQLRPNPPVKPFPSPDYVSRWGTEWRQYENRENAIDYITRKCPGKYEAEFNALDREDVDGLSTLIFRICKDEEIPVRGRKHPTIDTYHWTVLPKDPRVTAWEQLQYELNRL